MNILYFHVNHLILIGWESLDKIYCRPQKHNNSTHCMTTVNILKNIDCANFMRVRFAVDCNIWAFVINATSCITVQNIAQQWLIQRKTDGLLSMILLDDIQYNIINKACNRGVHWKMSSLEFHCWPRLAPRSTVEFSGLHFPMYPSIAGIIYIIPYTAIFSWRFSTRYADFTFMVSVLTNFVKICF
jgi:hypothetical protein